MVKRIILVHRWDGSPQADWYPWLQKELESRGFVVVIPKMPHPEAPTIDDWVSTLEKFSGYYFGPNTFLVGHSVGCQTILRFLSGIPFMNTPLTFGGVLLVAPWLTLKGTEEDSAEDQAISALWLNTPIDFDHAKCFAKKFTAIFSDDDPFVPLENEKLFKKKLGAKTIVEKKKGHYTQKTAPIVLKELLEMAK